MNRSPRRRWINALSVLLLAACASPAQEEQDVMDDPPPPRKEIIAPEGANPSAVFSRAVRAGDLIFFSGTIGTRAGTPGLVEGGIGAETEQALQNLAENLQAAGATREDVVKCTVFLADIADYAAMNEVYGRFFSTEPPARSTVAAGGLVLDARVEIECIALAPPTGARAP